MIGIDRQRCEDDGPPHHAAFILESDKTEQDVADQFTVGQGDQREGRLVLWRAPDRRDHPGLALAAEGQRVNLFDPRVLEWRLGSDFEPHAFPGYQNVSPAPRTTPGRTAQTNRTSR